MQVENRRRYYISRNVPRVKHGNEICIATKRQRLEATNAKTKISNSQFRGNHL